MENRYSRLHFYRRISLWIALLIAMFSIYLSSINNEISALDTFFMTKQFNMIYNLKQMYQKLLSY